MHHPRRIPDGLKRSASSSRARFDASREYRETIDTSQTLLAPWSGNEGEILIDRSPAKFEAGRRDAATHVPSSLNVNAIVIRKWPAKNPATLRHAPTWTALARREDALCRRVRRSNRATSRSRLGIASNDAGTRNARFADQRGSIGTSLRGSTLEFGLASAVSSRSAVHRRLFTELRSISPVAIDPRADRSRETCSRVRTSRNDGRGIIGFFWGKRNDSGCRLRERVRWWFASFNSQAFGNERRLHTQFCPLISCCHFHWTSRYCLSNMQKLL